MNSISDVSSFSPTQLRCEYFVDPLGIDSEKPRLDWILQAHDPKARGLRQTGYRVLVASSSELLAKDKGDLWDSGLVTSDQMNHIAYGGKMLLSDQRCWWKVQVVDQNGKTSPWSPDAQWTMGVLTQSDWQKAEWIGAPADDTQDGNATSILRREFDVKPGLRRAIVHICGLGQYEMSLNGKKISEDLMTPGWTNYKKTCLYNTYDITYFLHDGPNAIGLLLGNGMYRVAKGRYTKFTGSFGPLQAIAQIRLEYDDGSSAVIVTDGEWRSGVSPMTFSNVYGGEDWDARLVQKDWDKPGFDATHWLPVAILTGPGGILKGACHSAPPIYGFEVHQSISHNEIKPNVTVYDLGQEASHMVRFTVHGPAGSVVQITPSELVNPDGTVFRNNYNGKAFSRYILSGNGKESYAAKFYYGGCRYYQVECLPSDGGGEAPKVEGIEGAVVHSSSTPNGAFSCSNALFNRIYTMIRWAEVSNMMSVISDCPHRERLGWLEQDHLHGPSFRYNFEMSPLFTKIIADMNDGQDDSGLVPTTAPEYMHMSPHWRDAIEWGSSGVLLPWQQYEWTGDLEALRRNYPMMKHYVEYLTSQAHDGIAANGLGDWSGQHASPDTPKNLIATALYYHNADTLAKSAKLLGDHAEADAQERLATSIRDVFNATFFHADTNQYGTGSQCANSMALVFGLVDKTHRQAVLENLVSDLETRHYELTVGEVGLEYLFQALAAGGRSDVIYAMNNQSDKPGYGYQLKLGATALCETWNADRDNSQNQFMLGHLMEWLFHDLAGIQSDTKTPGFQHIVIRPQFVGDLTSAQGRYLSIQGLILSSWTRVGDQVTLNMTIPPNTTATVYVPAKSIASVKESGHLISKAVGIKSRGMENGTAVFEIGSGSYSFSSHL